MAGFCIDLYDAMQQTVARAGWVAAMEKASRALRAERSLHSTERRHAGEALHGMVRGLRRLRALCGGSHPSSAELYRAWLIDTSQAELPSDSHLVPPQIAARRMHIEERLQNLGALPKEQQIEALGEGLSYPNWIVKALLEDLGLAEALAVLRAQNQRAPLTVRTNVLRTDRPNLAQKLRAEGLLAHDTACSAFGLTLDGHVNVYATQVFADGLLEIQDEGSQLIAELCAPPPGGVVVDLCAGAGGKTLALGALLGNKGRIVAMDIDRRKLDELQRRARRAGLSNVQTVCLPKDWAHTGALWDLPEWLRTRGADRVLVDAPCSGLGVLRRHPEARWHMQPSDVAEIVGKQRAILRAAATLVRREGRNLGRLIYATCTVLRRENDEVVDDFLAAHANFAAVSAKEILGAARAAKMGDGQRLRLHPCPGGSDGFFAAVMRRMD